MRNQARSICPVLLLLFVKTNMAMAITPAWETQELSTGWQIKSLSPRPWLEKSIIADIHQGKRDEDWFAVPTMPAMVHDILQEHGKIEVPWRYGAAHGCMFVTFRPSNSRPPLVYVAWDSIPW
jgi:hypothetical protein